jgi:hypothetical protein
MLDECRAEPKAHALGIGPDLQEAMAKAERLATRALLSAGVGVASAAEALTF